MGWENKIVKGQQLRRRLSLDLGETGPKFQGSLKLWLCVSASEQNLLCKE